MNKKKSLKGFTLIELIIVLAIFSVIMTLVMSFIDPVSRLMTKTSLRERTSAYIDNIDEYITKSIRYAQNVNVYEHGYFNKDLTETECTEERIVRDFVDTYYDGAVSYKGDSTNLDRLTGKVHILKLINTSVPEEGLEAGHIYETVYKFTAGRSDRGDVDGLGPSYLYYGEVYTGDKLKNMSSADADKIKKGGNRCYVNDYHDGDSKYSAFFYHSVPELEGEKNVDVINPENFKEYNYYYKLGMHTFEPIDKFSDDKVFYSALKKAENSITPNMYNFPLSVVTYRKLNYKNQQNNLKTTTDGYLAFGSPAAMSSMGLSFKNAQMQKDERTVKFYREAIEFKYEQKDKKDAYGNLIYESDGSVAKEDDLDRIKSVVKKNDKNETELEAVTRNYVAEPFEFIDEYYNYTDNIYIVYSIPDEVNDTVFNLK